MENISDIYKDHPEYLDPEKFDFTHIEGVVDEVLPEIVRQIFNPLTPEQLEDLKLTEQ